MTTKTDQLKVESLDPDLLKPNPWNSNVMTIENEEKLIHSMKRLGVFKPVTARKLRDGTLQILGGAHRAKVAKRAGFSTIPVIVLEGISDNRAKEISLVDNARYGDDDGLKLSELFGSLEDPGILSDILPISDIEIETILAATKIDLDDLVPLDDDDTNIDTGPADLPKVSKTHTIMRFKVPVADAERIEEKIKRTMKLHDFTKADSLTNAGDALVHLLFGGDDAV